MKDKNEMGALFGLGLIYEQGLGVEKNEKQALEYYGIAAEMGHVMAEANVSKILTKKGPFTKLRIWLKTRFLVWKLMRNDPSVKNLNHPRLGIS